MNIDQYGKLMDTLNAILNRMPAAAPAVAQVKAEAARPGAVADKPNFMRVIAQRQALDEVLATLNGWIEGAKENHEAMGHRGENQGEECWNRFTPDDFRSMVADTALTLRLPPRTKANTEVPSKQTFLIDMEGVAGGGRNTFLITEGDSLTVSLGARYGHVPVTIKVRTA